MGANHSKEELLYKEVLNGNHDAVKALYREGASLEWVDKEGRTPLIVACTRGELLDMVTTLLDLGADINAYRAGAQGGFPLHHAAKRGHEKTAMLLLSRGANPLALNDDGHTALDLARSKTQVAVVRLLEERLCLFSGMVRELSGFGFLETYAPKFVTKKVWVVVVPTKLLSNGTASYELAVYESPKVSLWNGVHLSSTHPAGLCNVAQPRSKICLASAEVEEPDFSLVDPVVCMTDGGHKTKRKFLSENKGDKAQLEKLYKACKRLSLAQNRPSGSGVSSDRIDNHPTSHPSGNSSQIHPVSSHCSPGRQSKKMPVSVQSLPAVSSANVLDTPAIETMPDTPAIETMPEDLALALAIDESLRTAVAEGVKLPTASRADNLGGLQMKGLGISQTIFKRWGNDKLKHLERPVKVDISGWKAEQSFSECVNVSITGQANAVLPSAPPLSTISEGHATDGVKSRICVICWDALAEGVCIPCGHLAGCMRCLAELKVNSKKCPVCRGVVEQVIKVYSV